MGSMVRNSPVRDSLYGSLYHIITFHSLYNDIWRVCVCLSATTTRAKFLTSRVEDGLHRRLRGCLWPTIQWYLVSLCTRLWDLCGRRLQARSRKWYWQTEYCTTGRQPPTLVPSTQVTWMLQCNTYGKSGPYYHAGSGTSRPTKHLLSVSNGWQYVAITELTWCCLFFFHPTKLHA